MGVYRLRRQSVDQFDMFATGLNASDHGSIVGIEPTGSFVAVGGTNNSGVTNAIHKTTDFGKTWVKKDSGILPPLNACGISYRDGKVKIWGGNDGTSTINKSHEWDEPNGVVLISAAMTGYTTSGFNRAGASHFDDGTDFYSVSGNGCNNIVKSSNLTAWSSHMTLPADCQDSNGMTIFKRGGDWYLITGQINSTAAYPGKLYKFNSDKTALSLVLQDVMFERKWNDAAGTADVVFFVSGHRDGVGNIKGCYYNEGNLADIDDWIRMPYEFPATHANPLGVDVGDKDILSYCGNMRNDCWRFTRIDV
jgi:hypothetical protein